MSIDILIVDADRIKISQIAYLFKGHIFRPDSNMIRIKPSLESQDTTIYSNLSDDDIATLEFLPDFDTRYTYLLSLSLGINA